MGQIAAAFDAELRRHDRAFRIDGSLFAMLLAGGQRPPETTAVTLRIADRMRQITSREPVEIFFGVASVGPETEPADAIFRRAAASLVEARSAASRAPGVPASRS
jgi:GGDEF domain-containing protein